VTEDLHRTGILLVNLGTPDAPQTREVRRYLREFLSDPRVIDINPIGRWLLLNLFILPTRPKRSAEAYRKVWTEAGSPLLVYGRELTEALRARMPEHPIELAMRYGKPSIEGGLTRLRDAGCDRLVVLSLYPHYASSSTGSSLEKVYAEAGKLWNTPYINAVPAFYDHPAFIEAFADVARDQLEALDPQHLLFSFHGLPERQILRSAEPLQSPTRCLASPDCCAAMTIQNRSCYRAQCYETARLLARALDLGPGDGSLGDAGEGAPGWSVSFQSRLGRTPWIQPYTDEVLPVLAERGVQRVAVMCPAFVADCLETLEEIGIRASDDFVAAGGEVLELVPSLNASPRWVDATEILLREAIYGPRESLSPQG